MNTDIIIIGDTQVIPGSDTSHLHALARYIWKHKPGVVVHIGDHWDFESLCSYNTPLEMEGRRLKDDIIAGAKALDIIPLYIKKQNKKQKKKLYKPAFHLCLGNHEDRLDKMIQKQPVLDGMINLREMIAVSGWGLHEYLTPFWHEGICFCHYMPAAASGKAVGGGIENKLNKFPHSFVHGHQQQFQYGRRQNMEGRPHFGACAGSFYLHDFGYRGANNTEIRGFIHLKAFINRHGFNDFDLDFISVERLIQTWVP